MFDRNYNLSRVALRVGGRFLFASGRGDFNKCDWWNWLVDDQLIYTDPLIAMMFCFWSVVRAQTGGECIDFQYSQYNRVEERKRERKGREKHCALKWKSWQPLCHVDIPTNTENLFLSRFTQTIMRSFHTHKSKSLSGVCSPRNDFNFFEEKLKKNKSKKGERNKVWVS